MSGLRLWNTFLDPLATCIPVSCDPIRLDMSLTLRPIHEDSNSLLMVKSMILCNLSRRIKVIGNMRTLFLLRLRRLFSTLCGYIVEDLWQALARTRVNYEKLHFSNIYSRASTKCGNESSEPKKKRNTVLPDDFDPPREITFVTQTCGKNRLRKLDCFGGVFR